ncbi:MAG: hypothetical protein M3362_15045 [Acidobacteriota bacterium]|nr:hypothetical protein [Acidobacteriota bacterium]
MFAHRVTVNLKANSAPETARVIENEIIPMLRKQKGFCREVTSITGERLYADSYWETKEDAEAYQRTGYQKGLKSMVDVIVGLPLVSTFEVFNSTFQKLAA